MGALQILMKSNPLRMVRPLCPLCLLRLLCRPGRRAPRTAALPAPACLMCRAHMPRCAAPVRALPPLPLQPGLTTVQSLLFFEAAAHHWLAISTVFMAVVPIVYLFSSMSPMVVSEGCAVCTIHRSPGPCNGKACAKRAP